MITKWLKKLIYQVMKPWIEEAYTLGYEAGMSAERWKQREDQNRRLEQMYHYGIAMARIEERDANGVIEIDGEEFAEIVDDMGEAV